MPLLALSSGGHSANPESRRVGNYVRLLSEVQWTEDSFEFLEASLPLTPHPEVIPQPKPDREADESQKRRHTRSQACSERRQARCFLSTLLITLDGGPGPVLPKGLFVELSCGVGANGLAQKEEERKGNQIKQDEN